MTLNETFLLGPLLQEFDLRAADQVHVALQRLVVGDDADAESSDTTAGDEELRASSAHENTGNDSEASTSAMSAAASPSSGRKRASPVSSVASGSPATSTTSDGEHKKRKSHKKSTYIVRKEETLKLQKEMEILQVRLARLETQKNSARASLVSSERSNALLRESVRGQQLSLASAQCVVSGLLNGEQSNPLSTNHIRLGTDWDERRQTLLAMKERTIRHACEYIEARSRFLNPLKRHVCEERFENPNGDFCCARYDVHQFPNAKSVKQVFDALVSYLVNIEISVSEQLGDITTRDDFDFVDNSLASFRLLTTEVGVPVEKHGVLFMEYFESHELFNGEPCGVIAIDRVEEDELYPYTPQERLRKDGSLVIVLRPHWRTKPGTEGSAKELVVSMSMGKFMKLHHSKCLVATPEAIEEMRENVMGWGSVMIKTMREILNRTEMES
ncbi:hypothetical protein Gpo141_00011002 [Globisporangium polare]